jgi:alanyl-tRNA synthetase
MATERLYYDNPYLFEFDATILENIPLGNRFGLVLDRTAFYPTSGGQPHDLGTINGAPLVDCYEDESSGKIVHVVVALIDGPEAHGIIDASRRRDHMEQHSGQHVLSQAFVELFSWPTLSFHLGTATCTIDLGVDSISREEAAQAEELANRIVRENRSVSIRYISPKDLAEIGLRKPTERTGDIRIIDVSGYDRSACGGTHVQSTGEIGSILVTDIQRAKKQTRVEFICGDRVLQYAKAANRTLEVISQTVSVSPFEAGLAVKALWEDLQRTRKHVEELESSLLDHEAAAFAVTNGLAMGAYRGRGLETIKLLAQKICLRSGVLALLADESDQLRVVFARSADLSVDVSVLLKKTIERFGGRGGGRPNLAQGGGFTADSAQTVLEYARSLLSS